MEHKMEAAIPSFLAKHRQVSSFLDFSATQPHGQTQYPKTPRMMIVQYTLDAIQYTQHKRIMQFPNELEGGVHQYYRCLSNQHPGSEKYLKYVMPKPVRKEHRTRILRFFLAPTGEASCHRFPYSILGACNSISIGNHVYKQYLHWALKSMNATYSRQLGSLG